MTLKNDKEQYCNWDTRSLTDTIIVIVIIVIMFSFICRIIYRLLTYQIVEHYNKKAIIFLNFLIILWAMVNISRKSYGVIIYFMDL